MSNDKKMFLITFIGLTDEEEATLKRTFDVTISLKRPRSYTCIPFDDTRIPDIAIVNSDHPLANNTLNKLKAKVNETRKSLPVVYANQKPVDSQYYLKRPWFAGRVLKVIDEVTIREMDFTPEIKISDDANSSVSPAIKKVQRDIQPAGRTNSSNEFTALVVDDSLPVRKQVEMELRFNGVHADLVDCGEKALEAIKDKKYDAIFLDIVMPGINGYQTCKAIRSNAINRKTPVIMLTSKSSSFDRVKGKFSGCSSYITKPVARNEFQQVIKQYLSTPECKPDFLPNLG